MKVGIMQPYFFPYIGYISLIKHTDKFILFDPVQFIRHGWIERNRILKQNEGWLYIQVPLILKDGRDTIIKDVAIDNAQQWKSKILAQVQPYKKNAPYYFKVLNLLNTLFAEEYNDIVSLNKKALELICNYLGIEKKIDIFSDMHLDIEEVHAPDEWALNICKTIGNVKEYWNPPGGQSFFDKVKYNEVGIDLKFQSVKIMPYDQKNNMFEPGLSILDVMMFNSPEEINVMLDNYELI